jgi:hypothetical protein
LMPLAVAPRAPKWRRWFGVDRVRFKVMRRKLAI